jgi:hypothetical protein
MKRRCTCSGDPQREPCPWCERRIAEAEEADLWVDQDDDGRWHRDALLEALARLTARSVLGILGWMATTTQPHGAADAR